MVSTSEMTEEELDDLAENARIRGRVERAQEIQKDKFFIKAENERIDTELYLREFYKKRLATLQELFYFLDTDINKHIKAASSPTCTGNPEKIIIEEAPLYLQTLEALEKAYRRRLEMETTRNAAERKDYFETWLQIFRDSYDPATYN